MHLHVKPYSVDKHENAILADDDIFIYISSATKIALF